MLVQGYILFSAGTNPLTWTVGKIQQYGPTNVPGTAVEFAPSLVLSPNIEPKKSVPVSIFSPFIFTVIFCWSNLLFAKIAPLPTLVDFPIIESPINVKLCPLVPSHIFLQLLLPQPVYTMKFFSTYTFNT